MNATRAIDPFAGLDQDPLAEILDNAGTATPAPRRQPPASYEPQTFEERCPKCRGSGRFTGWSGRSFGQCFACKGAGKKTFKTSTEQRAKARAASADKKAAQIETFKTEYPDVWAWMDGSDFQPAQQMLADLMKYGSLFDNRIEFARRMIAKRDEARAAKEALRQVAMERAPVVGDALQRAFDHAAAAQAAKSKGEAGWRKPVKLYFGEFAIAAARKYPGTLYVNGQGGDYLGKIVAGKFLKSRECSEDVATHVAEIVADPKAAAIRFGQRRGVCCVCNAGLRNHDSIERGIGPICAEKMGW